MKLIERTSLKPVVDNTGPSMKLRFPFLTVDEVNENGRVYPVAVVTKALSDMKRRIEDGRSVFGSNNHPKEGSPLEVDQVSHLISDVYLAGGQAWAEAILLPTQKGKNLQAIIANGGAVGTSARGKGTITKVENHDEVGTDYKLESVDFVLDPSFNTFATSEGIFESVQFDDPDRLDEGGKFHVHATHVTDAPRRFKIRAKNTRHAWAKAGEIVGKTGHKVKSVKFVGEEEEGVFESVRPEQINEAQMFARFRLAREAGYKGTLEDYKKI
jgi:hypothetical protein